MQADLIVNMIVPQLIVMKPWFSDTDANKFLQKQKKSLNWSSVIEMYF